MLADIGFADILVLLPVIAPGGEHPADTPGARLENLTDTGHPDGRLESPADPGYPDSRLESPADPGQPADGGDTAGGTGGRFVVTAHSRPMTSQTVHPEDLVGRVIAPSERPLAEMALRTGASSNGGAYLAPQRRWVQSLAVPVNHSGRTVAVLLREFPSTSDRVWGRLENTYFAIFRRLAGMIADGAIACAALCIADLLSPGTARGAIAGHLSAEPASGIALEHLGLRPLLDLDLRLGEGTGACLAFPLVRAAADALAGMAALPAHPPSAEPG